MKQFDSVWFADEEKFNSSYKGIVYSNKGELYFDEHTSSLVYQSGKLRIEIENIKNVYRSRSAFPWLTYLIGNSIFLPFLLITNRYNWTYILMIILPGNILGLISGWWCIKWIVIEYSDNNGGSKKVYFFDGRKQGYSGLFGGTTKLYNRLVPSVGKQAVTI